MVNKRQSLPRAAAEPSQGLVQAIAQAMEREDILCVSVVEACVDVKVQAMDSVGGGECGRDREDDEQVAVLVLPKYFVAIDESRDERGGGRRRGDREQRSGMGAHKRANVSQTPASDNTTTHMRTKQPANKLRSRRSSKQFGQYLQSVVAIAQTTERVKDHPSEPVSRK
jgi:hypothetical protein